MNIPIIPSCKGFILSSNQENIFFSLFTSTKNGQEVFWNAEIIVIYDGKFSFFT
jgi:hypothetical protein